MIQETSDATTASNNGSQPLLEVRDLTKHFPVVRGTIFRREVGVSPSEYRSRRGI